MKRELGSKRIWSALTGMMVLTVLLAACASGAGRESKKSQAARESEHSVAYLAAESDGGIDTATFAAGCFWCVEAQFLELAGVVSVEPGYTGGHSKNPTYKQVITGSTGHAESIQIVYHADSLTYDELLEAFFVAHDPTQLNRQGNDVGTQYRSAIFYHNARQRDLAQYYIQTLNKQQVYPKSIVTQLGALDVFYEAEDYHKNYYALNRSNPYCVQVIAPKLEEFKRVFADKLKK